MFAIVNNVLIIISLTSNIINISSMASPNQFHHVFEDDWGGDADAMIEDAEAYYPDQDSEFQDQMQEYPEEPGGEDKHSGGFASLPNDEEEKGGRRDVYEDLFDDEPTNEDSFGEMADMVPQMENFQNGNAHNGNFDNIPRETPPNNNYQNGNQK